jgi:tetratricopeptide (TPR) repeat protein
MPEIDSSSPIREGAKLLRTLLLMAGSALAYIANLLTNVDRVRTFLGPAWTAWLLFALSWVITAAFSLFVVLKKHTIGARFGTPTPTYLYPKWARGCAIALLVLPSITLLRFVVQKDHGPKPFSIAVADIDGPTNLAVTEILTEQLGTAARRYRDMEVTSLHKSISAQQGSPVARAEGAQAGASVVIWGWYRITPATTLVTLHCELLTPDVSAWTNRTETAGIYPIRQLEGFEVQRQLGSDVTSLVLFFNAMSRLKAGDYAGVIALATEAIDHIPQAKTHTEDPYFYLTRAFAYTHMPGVQSAWHAIADFTQVISMKPDLVDAYIDRAASYAAVNKHKEALADCDKALDLVPAHPVALANKSAALCNLGRLKEGLEAAQAVSKAVPWFPLYRLSLAQALNMNDRNDEAIFECNAYLKERPGDPHARLLRAQIYKDAGRLDLAERELTELIKVESIKAGAYYARGDVYMTRSDFQKALTDYDAFVRLRPNNPDGRVMRAQMREMLGDHLAAIQDLDVALDWHTNLTEVKLAGLYGLRGTVYSSLGNFPAAFTNFSNSIALEPNSSVTRKGRGMALYNLGWPTNALNDLSESLSLNPRPKDRAEASFYRGVIYLWLGRHSNAVTDLTATLSLAPNDPAAHLYRGVAYFKQADLTNALHDCEMALTTTNDTQTLENARSLRAALKESGL